MHTLAKLATEEGIKLLASEYDKLPLNYIRVSVVKLPAAIFFY